ncbi:MAG: hypothetical protein R6V14_01435 [Halanaerobiales bacterium]
MDKIKDLTKFLEKNFPEELNDMKASLELLKELLQKSNDSIGKSMSKLVKDNKHNTAREYINKSEDITEYIQKLESIISQVTVPSDDKSKVEKTLNTVKEVKVQKEENAKNEDNKEDIDNIINYDEYSLDKNQIHYLDENLKYTQPCAFFLGNEQIKVESWSEMLVETSRILKDRDNKKFIAFMNNEDFKGARRPYFSFERKNMSDPKIISLGCKKIFIETNLSVNVINKLLHKLVKQYGIDLKEFKIYLKEEPSEALEK